MEIEIKSKPASLKQLVERAEALGLSVSTWMESPSPTPFKAAVWKDRAITYGSDLSYEEALETALDFIRDNPECWSREPSQTVDTAYSVQVNGRDPSPFNSAEGAVGAVMASIVHCETDVLIVSVKRGVRQLLESNLTKTQLSGQ